MYMDYSNVVVLAYINALVLSCARTSMQESRRKDKRGRRGALRI